MIRAVADALVGVLLAPVCACCSTPLAAPSHGAVCDACWSSIPSSPERLCAVCGDALPDAFRIGEHTREQGPRREALCARCRRSSRVISRGQSIAAYEGVLRDILHALKYDGRRSLAAPLGRLMRARGADVLDGADALVPVPLHWFREYRRGFNQAAELARHIGLPVVHCLRRTRATRTQTDLPERRRQANVRGAFAMRRTLRSGLVLVIVDDVSTTGATVDACARALLDAGARDVRALTAARAAARLP